MIYLTKTDPACSMARFYSLDIQPTLFGEWALMKEWGRTDISYAARISDLQNGGGLNGSFVLNNTTLSVHSGATDQLFNGSKGSDWFLLSPGDQDNAAAGETVTTI